MENNDEDRLVVAATFPDDVSAHIALGVLRTNGVECVLNNELMSDVFALPTAQFGGIRLLVHACDLKQALSLLDLPAQADGSGL